MLKGLELFIRGFALQQGKDANFKSQLLHCFLMNQFQLIKGQLAGEGFDHLMGSTERRGT